MSCLDVEREMVRDEVAAMEGREDQGCCCYTTNYQRYQDDEGRNFGKVRIDGLIN